MGKILVKKKKETKEPVKKFNRTETSKILDDFYKMLHDEEGIVIVDIKAKTEKFKKKRLYPPFKYSKD